MAEELRIILPERSEDEISNLMRELTKGICEARPDLETGYGLGGRNGYGVDIETDVFMMKPFCWCDEESCGWCSGEKPNFLHKPSGAALSWYKYIGRGMAGTWPHGFDWPACVRECIESVRAASSAEAKHE